MGFMFCDLHVSLNNPSSGDINSSNLSCSFSRSRKQVDYSKFADGDIDGEL